MEPLIKDPPRKGQPLNKGHFPYPQKCTCKLQYTSKEDSHPLRNKMGGPKVSFTRSVRVFTVLVIRVIIAVITVID